MSSSDSHPHGFFTWAGPHLYLPSHTFLMSQEHMSLECQRLPEFCFKHFLIQENLIKTDLVTVPLVPKGQEVKLNLSLKLNSLPIALKGQQCSGSTYFLQLRFTCEDSQFKIQSPGTEEHDGYLPTGLHLHIFCSFASPRRISSLPGDTETYAQGHKRARMNVEPLKGAT